MKIGIGNDHSALELKAEIISFLKEIRTPKSIL